MFIKILGSDHGISDVVMLQFLSDDLLVRSNGCKAGNFFFAIAFAFLCQKIPFLFTEAFQVLQYPHLNYQSASLGSLRSALAYLVVCLLCWTAFNTNCYRLKGTTECGAWKPFLQLLYLPIMLLFIWGLFSSSENYFEIYRGLVNKAKKNEEKVDIDKIRQPYFSGVNTLPEQIEEKRKINGKSISDEQTKLLATSQEIAKKKAEESQAAKKAGEDEEEEKPEPPTPDDEFNLPNFEKMSVGAILTRFSMAPKVFGAILFMLAAFDTALCGTII